jgi:hypothetical protein
MQFLQDPNSSSWANTFSSATCLQAPSVSALALISETKFHRHKTPLTTYPTDSVELSTTREATSCAATR